MAERKPIIYVSGNPQEIADTDRVKNTGITRSGTAPSSPQDKDAWLDTSTGQLKVYQSGAWHSPTYLQSVNTDLVYDTTPQLGGNLDVNGRTITSASNGNIGLDPNGSGDVVIKGNSTRGAGAIQLNCEFNSHGIKLKSPPHSANASYTLTFPNNAGTNGYALTTNGSGVLSWTEQVPNGSITSAKLANDITIAGNLTVNGTTTTVNSTTLSVDDKNIELGSVSSPSDTTADGGGITLKGASDKTITWVNSTDCWTFNQSVNLTAGTASAPALILNGDVNTGFFQTATDEIAVGTAGSERLRVGPAGQVGIGGANYGTSGQVLMSGGASAAPTWGDVSSSPTIEATASGSIANGAKVVVQSDGTVTSIVRDQASESIGSSTRASSGSVSQFPLATVYVPDQSKVVVFYKNVSNNSLYAVAGTVSGTTISFGTQIEVTSDSVETDWGQFDACYDTNANRIMCVYRNKSVSDRGMARVLSLSGTTLTVGSEIIFNTARTTWPCVVFDSSQNKVVVFFGDGSQDRHTYAVGTISTSGNTATFQSKQLISGNYTARYFRATFSGNNQILHAYYNADGGRGYARICTLSGNTLTLGSQETFHDGDTQNVRVAYHPENNEFYVSYTDGANDYGQITAASFTGTGTGLQFGNEPNFETYNAYKHDIAYNPKTKKIHLIWRSASGSLKYTTVTSDKATAPSMTVGGESDMQPYNATNHPYMVYDESASKLVFFHQRTNTSPTDVYATVYQPAYDSSNLEANNYVGISDAAYTNGQTATIQVVGSVDDAQSGLTAGKAYYIQKDGTLSLIADTPSVVAGVALSSTKLLIK